MAGAIKISVVGDVSDVTARALPQLESGLEGAARTADRASREVGQSFDRVAESSDALASGSAQVAGGLGDLGGALELLPGPLGAIGGGMNALTPAIMGVTGASDLLNAATEKFPRVAKIASGAARGLGVAVRFATGPVGLIIIGLAALAAGLYFAYRRSETFRRIVNGVFAAVKTVILNFTPIGQVIKHFDELVGFTKKLPGRLANAGAGMWDWMKGAFTAPINYVIDKWNGLSFSIPSVDTHIPGIGKVGGFTLSTPDIPHLARGGIVVAGDNPSGIEAIIPLERAGELGFGGTANVYNINITVSPTANLADVGREIVRAVEAYESAGGRRRAS